MASSVELSSSLQLDQLSLPVDAQEARDAPTLDLFDHHAQRLDGLVTVGGVSTASTHSGNKENVPVDPDRIGLVDEYGKAPDFLRQFVHADGRGECSALTALEGLSFGIGGIGRQLCLREHQQQALRLRLASRLGEQVIEVFQGHTFSLAIAVGQAGVPMVLIVRRDPLTPVKAAARGRSNPFGVRLQVAGLCAPWVKLIWISAAGLATPHARTGALSLAAHAARTRDRHPPTENDHEPERP